MLKIFRVREVWRRDLVNRRLSRIVAVFRDMGDVIVGGRGWSDVLLGAVRWLDKCLAVSPPIPFVTEGWGWPRGGSCG